MIVMEIKEIIPYLPLLIIVLVFVVVFLYERRICRLYESIASEHGWYYEKCTVEIPFSTVTQYGKSLKGRGWVAGFVGKGAGPAILGEANSRKFALVRYTEGSGKSSVDYTLIGTRHKGLSGSAYISKEGFLQKLGKAIGMQDIELGDPLFDPVFRIKGDYADTSTVLDIATRQKLLNLISQHGWENFGVLEINQKEVVFTKNKVIRNKDFILAVIDLVTSIANNVDRAG